MSALPPPPPPFDTWPPHLVDEEGRLYAWYFEPRTLVFSFTDEELSLDAARAAVKWIEAVLHPRREFIREQGGLRVVHDARKVATISTDALRYLQQVWGRLKTADVERGWYVNDGSMSALARSIMQTLNFVAMLTTRRPMTLARTIEEPFATLGLVAPPPAGVKFPGS